MGPGNVVTPVVLSPSRVPSATEIAECGDRVDLAVVVALVHAGGPQSETALGNLTGILAKIAEHQAQQYSGYLIEILPDEPRKYLEDPMTAGTHSYPDAFTRLRARGREEGREEGVAEGEAKMLLRLLRGRGLAVSDEVRSRVMSCEDTAQLEAWFDRATKAAIVDEVFETSRTIDEP